MRPAIFSSFLARISYFQCSSLNLILLYALTFALRPVFAKIIYQLKNILGFLEHQRTISQQK